MASIKISTLQLTPSTSTLRFIRIIFTFRQKEVLPAGNNLKIWLAHVREELHDNLRIDEFGDFSMLSMTNKFYKQKCFSIGFCLQLNFISFITWLVEIVTLIYQRIFLVIIFVRF